MIVKFFASFVLSLSIFSLMPVAYAQTPPVDVFNDICKNAPTGVNKPAACQDKELGGKNPLYGPDGIITKVVSVLSIAVGAAAVVEIIYASSRIIISGKTPQEIAENRDLIIYAVIGLFVAALAQALIRLVLFKLG